MIVSTKIAKLFKDCGFVNIDYLVENKINVSPSKILNALNRDWRRGIKPLSMLNKDDPIFGFNDIGGTENSTLSYIGMACKYPLTESGRIMSITAYVKLEANGNLKAGLYADVVGVPTNLLSQSGAVGVGLTFSWVDFDIVDYVASPADYWLAWIADQVHYYRYDAGDVNQGACHDVVYPDFPNPFGSVTPHDEKMSIYATYTSWTGKISGVTNPARVMGVAAGDIAKVKGVS